MGRFTSEIDTRHGHLSVAQSREDGPAVLFIHGNSSCKEIFDRQLNSPLGEQYRLIAFDLPGHGASGDAPDPQQSYSIPGFAGAACDLLAAVGVDEAVLVGWSLGGHVALEMMAQWPGTRAAWITGTPPVGANPDDMAKGFLPSEHMDLTFKAQFTDDEAFSYAREAIGENVKTEDWMIAAAKRTDGRFRPLMLQAALEGKGEDQRRIVETAAQPLAVVSGELEPFVNNAYLHELAYANLWDGRVHVLNGLGHTPFWEAPEAINPLLGRFFADVTP